MDTPEPLDTLALAHTKLLYAYVICTRSAVNSKAVLLLWIIYVISVFVMLSYASVIDALWSSAGKRLTSWLSSVMSNCEVVHFPLVSWVRCGTGLYRFLSIAFVLILTGAHL